MPARAHAGRHVEVPGPGHQHAASARRRGAARIGSARRRDGALGRAARTGRAAVAAADQLHRDVCACDALRRHAPGRGRDDGAVVLAEQLEYATGRRLRRTILLALLPHFPSFLYDILFICS
jgi:hypothetical protein